jgi:hypothetical protein
MNANIFEIELKNSYFRKSQDLFSKNRRQKVDESNLWWSSDKETIQTHNSVHIIQLFCFCNMKNDQWKRKNRVMIDIRDLNSLILSNAYSLFLQSDIISAVTNCKFLSVINCAFFFYQWRVHFLNRYKLIVVSHRE